MKRDPELAKLLLQELEKHVRLLHRRPDDEEAARRAVHALKGSAGLAGERELAAALERIERRIKEQDTEAFGDAAALVEQAITNLSAGRSASPSQWPEPPLDLGPARVSQSIRAQYLADATDRLAAVDEALAAPGTDAMSTVTVIYRHVHTLKGAASAVGDEPMAWFCHGLEDRLRAAKDEAEARGALQQVARWRTVLGGLLEDSERALSSLRTGLKRRPSSSLPAVQPPSVAPKRADGTRGPEDEARARAADATTIRVSAEAVDRLLERVEAVGLVRELLSLRIERGRDDTGRLRHARTMLVEALRLIGPPRPWGAPAAALRRIDAAVSALGAVADELDAGVATMRGREQILRDAVTDAKKDLSTMRLTTVRGVFERLARTVESEAPHAGRAVVVRMRGADEPVDRRLAEALVEPCLQLVRNAVAHGIEIPADRSARGKVPQGTITLEAQRRHGRLVITIGDDGAGVDVEAVRRRGIAIGMIDVREAAHMDDASLLGLLFAPGFSTVEQTDLLAGRGIGLDIALGAVRRLGGGLRLSTRAGEGLVARVDVPVESGITSVLWVVAGGERYALPAWPTRGVRASSASADGSHVPHLVACLDDGDDKAAPFVVDFEVHDDEKTHVLSVGVDAVGVTEELLVRPLSPLVVGIGPFSGAVVLGDGALHLALDVEALAPRVRALTVAS